MNFTYGLNDSVGNLSGFSNVVVYDSTGKVKFSGGSSSAAWGSIGSGTGVGSQTDLITYLNTNYYPLASNPLGYLTSSAAASTYVPLTRSITINGVTQDLSADRTWTISTGVTSVSATSPITSTGGATPVISTSIATNRIVGRTTAGAGVMEELTVGIGLELVAGTLKSTDFDFSLNFESAIAYTIILPYNFRIDTVDDPTPITYTITVNAVAYVLGTTINAQDVVVVTPGAIGWINLNCTRLS